MAAPSEAQTAASGGLTHAQMREAAANAIVSGDARLGYQMASALLERDPRDVEALVIHARAARDMGRLSEARETARLAWRLARTPSERFGASMIMAQTLSTSGARTRAQLWLRRAAQNAPNDRFKSIAVRDFRYVQQINPWSTELSFSVAPSSNINNGSSNASTRLFDLPFEFELSGAARALSGLQITGAIATRYRVHESATSQHDLLFRAHHQTYRMSEEAKLQAPNAKGSDFAFSTASLTYIRRGFSLRNARLPNQFSLTGGQTWYGQKPLMRFGKLGFTQNFVVAPGSYGFLGWQVEQQEALSTRRRDANSWSMHSGFHLTGANKNRTQITLTLKRNFSKDVDLDFRSIRLGLSYALAQPIAGVYVDFGLGVAHQTHEFSRFSAFGRQDTEISASATALFSQIEYYGFSPSVTVTARQTLSSIGLYDKKDFGIHMGIRSAF